MYYYVGLNELFLWNDRAGVMRGRGLFSLINIIVGWS